MATWIPWREIKEELMQDASFREGYEEEFEEFKRQNAAELASERAAMRFRLSPFTRKSRAHSLRRPTTAVRPAVEA